MKRFLLLLALVAVPADAADIDAVRQNFIGYYTGEGADQNAPLMAGALGELENTALAYTAPGFLLSDGSWSDINYSETPSGSWSPWDHVRRLTVMAKAYRTAGQSLYRDPQLLVEIESALRYVNTFYGRNNRDNALGIVFWSAGAFDGYQSDAPATVYITQDTDGLHISAADPTGGATGTFHLTVPIGARSTTIEIPRNGGRTFTTTIKPLQSKRRAVR